MTSNPNTLSVDLSKLTPKEAHALRTHLRYAGDESYAAHGASDTVRELDKTFNYVDSVSKNVLGTGKAYVKPAIPLDHADIQHEALFGALNAEERRAFAVHMVHAWEESTHIGVADFDMRGDLMALAHEADYAAQAQITDSGLVIGRTARKLMQPVSIGAPAKPKP